MPVHRVLQHANDLSLGSPRFHSGISMLLVDRRGNHDSQRSSGEYKDVFDQKQYPEDCLTSCHIPPRAATRGISDASNPRV
jgi:hypothetical protein